MNRYPLFFLMGGTSAALVVGLLIVSMRLDPPSKDMQQLLLFMGVSGLLTVFAAYLFNRLGLVWLLPSLRWSLLINIIMTVLLVLVNVWFTAQLMFISQHDFVLTTALLVFSGLTALNFGMYVASTITARLHDLSGAAEQLAQGKLETRLTVQGHDELADFIRTFNWMAENLQAVDREKRMIEQTRRDLIAWVSHDLRTPLTSIRAMLEAIKDEVVTEPDDVHGYIRSSLSEIENLNLLIEDLFELAKLDTGNLELKFVDASLRDLISDVLSTLGAQANKHHITLRGMIEQEVVYIAPEKMQRVLYNLIDNALRYTPPNGEVVISTSVFREHVQVNVHNSGTYIAPEHIPHLFTSFYRVEPSRVNVKDGRRSTGLGLAIARGFIEAHRGKIWVDSQPDQGTTFSFTIPRVSPR